MLGASPAQDEAVDEELLPEDDVDDPEPAFPLLEPEPDSLLPEDELDEESEDEPELSPDPPEDFFSPEPDPPEELRLELCESVR
ncbi:hypothetical protein ACQBAT_02860 [Ornithinimicrobium sp. Y1847]|uniref:hypothetical protein n=1 Tax=Ornithinimicrobium sp. Y1847 TaxID=3405419 RepID=UPI003B66FA6A